MIGNWKIRLLFLGIGLLVGVLSGGVPGAIIYRNTVKSYNERMALFEKMTAQSIKNTAALREENEKLRTKKVERTHADGSTEVITETSKDSSSSDEEYSREIAMLEHSLQVLKEKQQIEKTEEKRGNVFGVGIGINQSMEKHLYLKYGHRFYGWMTVNQGFDEYVIGIGMGL